MTKQILLTRGKVALVDDDIYDYLNQWKWHVVGTEKPYAKRTSKGIAMHRVITNAPKGMAVDHINGNTLDNRRSNLRVCTQAENNRNSRRPKSNTSGYKGVGWNSQRGKWRAVINFQGKCIMKICSSAIEAAHVYDVMAKELFGKFARLNFPEQS